MDDSAPSDARLAWLRAYATAWERADADGVAELFTEHAVYRSHAFRRPHVGRDGVTAYWRQATRDQRDVRVRWGDPLTDGPLTVVEWWTTMALEDGSPLTLPGVLMLRFDGARCAVLDEWWHTADEWLEPYEGWGVTAPGDTAATRRRAAAFAADYHRAWTRHDIDAVVELFSDAAVYRSHPFRPPSSGADGIRAYTSRVFGEVTASSPQLAVVAADGASAAVTYRATLLTAAAGAMELAGVDLVRFGDDGRVAELRDYWQEQLLPGSPR